MQLLEPQRGHVTPAGRKLMAARLELPDNDAFYQRVYESILWGKLPPIGGGAGASDYAENKVLDHILGKTEFAKPTVRMALTTVVPTDEKTGATITEASYTGYARLEVPGASWAAASGGVSKNSATLTFGECTAGTSTLKGWALCDSAGAGTGNVLVWGTLTEVTISTTATPPTIAANKLEVTLD